MSLSIGIRAGIVVAGGLILALAACSSPTAPKDSRTVTSIVVAGTAPAVGASLPFTATAVWSDGAKENVTATATWQSSNPAILTVSSYPTRTSIPVHGNSALKIGTLRGILRDIDMSPDEFERLWDER